MKNETRKLRLNKETIQILTRAQLGAVAGGGTIKVIESSDNTAGDPLCSVDCPASCLIRCLVSP